jgi:hypothetical protein
VRTVPFPQSFIPIFSGACPSNYGCLMIDMFINFDVMRTDSPNLRPCLVTESGAPDSTQCYTIALLFLFANNRPNID